MTELDQRNKVERINDEDVKVLLVDDQPSLLQQAVIYLEKYTESLEIETSKSAKRGLELIEEEKYDVIVSDYQMPRMDGIEFLQMIRREHDGIPFIMFTGKGREEIAMEALNNGANKYLQKKGDPREVFSELAEAIYDESIESKDKNV